MRDSVHGMHRGQVFAADHEDQRFFADFQRRPGHIRLEWFVLVNGGHCPYPLFTAAAASIRASAAMVSHTAATVGIFGLLYAAPAPAAVSRASSARIPVIAGFSDGGAGRCRAGKS